MYRKVCLLLFLNFQTFNLFMKLTVMICIMFLMMLMIVQHHPFILNEHNYLEYYSSISSLFLIFAAFLYISEVSTLMKALCFVFINITNFLFIMSWTCGILKILVFKYSHFFLKYLPTFVVIIMTINSTLWFMIKRNCVNPIKITGYFRHHYRLNETIRETQNTQRNQRMQFLNEMNSNKYRRPIHYMTDFLD